MPLSWELTEVFLGIFDEICIARLATTLARQQPYGTDRPINGKAVGEALSLVLQYKNDKGKNYEGLLTKIQEGSERPTASQSDKDSYHFVFGVLYDLIHEILCLYQSIAYEVLYPKNLRWFSKLDNLLSDQETWVISLNHDLFLECLAIDFGLPVSYGATGEVTFPVSNLEMHKGIAFSKINRESYKTDSPGFIHEQRGINLIKLHGSLTEHEYDDGKEMLNPALRKKSSRELINDFHNIQQMAYFHEGQPVPSGRERAITGRDGELDLMSKAMLTGGRKYSTTAKIKDGEEKLAVFDDVLDQVTELTIIGYGFGDRHVNFRIANAMARRNGLIVRVIDPVRSTVPDCLQPFDYDSRVRRALCGAAHWMDYCRTNRWDPEQIKCLKENVAHRNVIRQQVESRVDIAKAGSLAGFFAASF
jgi:hypothetical protein